MNRLLTVREVCERLQIGTTLGYELIARDEIRYSRIGGRVIRVSEKALDDYIRRQEERNGA